MKYFDQLNTEEKEIVKKQIRKISEDEDWCGPGTSIIEDRRKEILAQEILNKKLLLIVI